MTDDLRDWLVERITNVIVHHQLTDYASKCNGCAKELYGGGGGMTLAHHRAEKIVDDLELVDLYQRAQRATT